MLKFTGSKKAIKKIGFKQLTVVGCVPTAHPKQKSTINERRTLLLTVDTKSGKAIPFILESA